MMTVIDEDEEMAISDANLIFHRENFVNDTFFTNDSIIDTKKKIINSSIYLKKPHKTLHVFHNIKRENVYVTFENQLKSPVEYNPEIYGDEGVYIVERYIIPYVMGADIRGLNKYYNTGLDISDDVINSIKNILHLGVDDSTKNDVIRFIGFVSKEDLIIDVNTFIVDQKILLSLNNTEKMFPSNKTIDMKNGMMNLTIHDSRNPNKAYYLNSFNVIRKIMPEKGLIKDGIYITYKNNGIITKLFYNLNEKNNVGVYNTREEALAHGDLNAYLELAKFRHTMDSMKVESMNRLITLKTNIQKSNMDVLEKKLNMELLDEKIKLEGIRVETAKIKSRSDANAGKLKSADNIIGAIGIVGKVVSKLL